MITNYKSLFPIEEKKERKIAIFLIFLFGIISIVLYFFIYKYIMYEISQEHKDVFRIISNIIFAFMLLSFLRYNKETNLYENLILGTGTLGTFIGIFFAFSQFSPNASSSEQLYSSITNVIYSLKFIFATSILGIGTSIWLRCLKGAFRHFLIKGKNDETKERYLFDFMDAILVNTKYLFEMIKQKDETNTEKLEKINANVSSITDDFKVQIGEFVENTYQRILDGLYQNIKDRLGESFSAFDAGMKENVELLKQNKDIFINLNDVYNKIKDQQDVLKSLINNSQENIKSQNNFVEEINTKFESYTTSIKNQQTIFEDFKTILNNLNEKENTLSQTITDFSNNITTSIQSINDKTNEFFKEFQSVTENIITNTSTQQTEILNKLQGMTTEFMTQTETRIKESATNSENIEQKIKESIESMITNIDRQQEDLKQIFNVDKNDLKTTINESVERNFNNLKDIVETTNNEFSKTLKDSIQQYIDIIMKIKESQETTTNEIINNKTANNFIDSKEDKKEEEEQ